MTWTKEDTERLRNKGKEMPAMFFLYAASHIEALEARVAELEGPCSFCLETPGHGASKPICDGCAQLATDQAKTSRDLVERIAALKAERARVAELEANAKWSFDLVVKRLGGDRVLWPKFSDLVVGASDRIATLEAERANSIPRDVLVRALERNGCDCECEHHYSEHDADCQRCLACRLAAAIESGAWPGEGGGDANA